MGEEEGERERERENNQSVEITRPKMVETQTETRRDLTAKYRADSFRAAAERRSERRFIRSGRMRRRLHRLSEVNF